MCMTCKRRALMQGGGGDKPTFGVLMQATEFYQWGEIVEETQYMVSTTCSDKLIGSNSEYVIITESPDNHSSGGVTFFIVPRDHMTDTDLLAFAIPMKVESSDAFYQGEEVPSFTVFGPGYYNLMNAKSWLTSGYVFSGRNWYSFADPSQINMIDDFWINYFLELA